MKPDFLLKPYEVYSHKGLRPSDSDVYAVIYWFEHMKDGRCTASNETIANVACLKLRTIGMALERLEQYGFIKRIYEDAERAKRIEIKTSVRMTKTAFAEEKKPIAKKKKTDIAVNEEATPGDIARDFFARESNCRENIINEVCEHTGAPKDTVMKEVRKFYVYWTEPTKNGKKQRWETQQTFEIKRRLYRWLSQLKSERKTGSGTII